MLPGETILSGAPQSCPDCGIIFEPEVLKSGAGYFIGTHCNCGPCNSRETDYFPSLQEAEECLSDYQEAFRKLHRGYFTQASVKDLPFIRY